MKICIGPCGLEKEDDAFRERTYPTKSGLKKSRYGECSDCQDKRNGANQRTAVGVKYQHEYHQKVRKERRQQLRDERISIIRALKEKTPCTDCGKKYPHYVMEFDHLRDKEENVSRLLAHCFSMERVWREISKCEIVCSNCHRARTWKRAHD